MLYGSQKRFDKNGDGKLKGAEWQRWYQYTCGDEIEAKEKRRRANAAAEQKRAQIAANFTDHVSDLINWIYRDLAHLEGEREDQAIRTMHLALYVISAALQTQKVDESMRYLLRAFWNEFQPTFAESVYQALCAKQVLFAEIGEISEKRLGSFWKELLDELPPERRVGKDDDLQELLDDTNRLYNYFCDDSAPEIDFVKEIEPYWAAIRLPEEAGEPEEYDEDEEEPIREIQPGREYEVLGSAKLDDVNEALGTKLESEDYDSVGGYILEQLDCLRREGESVTLEDGMHLVVDELDKNRIELVHIWPPEHKENPEAADA